MVRVYARDRRLPYTTTVSGVRLFAWRDVLQLRDALARQASRGRMRRRRPSATHEAAPR